MRPRRSARKPVREWVLCKLCQRTFKALTWTHLVRRHGFSPEEAVDEYKRRFKVKRVLSKALILLKGRNSRRYFERIGRHWTRSKIRRDIRRRARASLSLNHAAVSKEAKALALAAVRLFGSWDAALRASGVSVRKVRLARRWSHKSLSRAIRKMERAGMAINAKAVQLRDPGLYQSACRWFGGWDFALRASGFDPSTVRLSRE